MKPGKAFETFQTRNMLLYECYSFLNLNLFTSLDKNFKFFDV